MYGHQSAARLPDGYPQFFARGEGSHIWDVDGNNPAENEIPRALRFTSEAARRGVYLHPNHNWFISTAHTEHDIARTLEVTDLAFSKVRAGPQELARVRQRSAVRGIVAA